MRITSYSEKRVRHGQEFLDDHIAMNSSKGICKLDDSSRKRRQFPAYGSQLMKLRLSGSKVPSRMVMVVFDWKLARAWPRIVITDDTRASELNFIFLAGIPVQVVYRDKDSYIINAITQAILRADPSFLSTFALDLVDTGKATTIIKPLQKVEQVEVLCA